MPHSLAARFVSAYITGAAILIILSQLKHVLQIDIEGRKVSELLPSILSNIGQTHKVAIVFALGTIFVLWFVSRFVVNWLRMMHMKKRHAKYASNVSPIILVIAATYFTTIFNLDTRFGLSTVGEIPAKVPSISFPVADLSLEKPRIGGNPDHPSRVR